MAAVTQTARRFLLAGIVCLLCPLSVFAEQGKLAYLAHTSGFWQVWTMQPDGAGKKQVTTSQYDKSHISWYPDGVHLLVNGNQGRLKKVDTLSGSESSIELPIKGSVDAVVSPDGKHIAFSLSVAGSIDNNHIWLVDANGKHLVKLTNMAGLQHEPVWSPDGEWVYFLSGKGRQAHDIWRVSLRNKATEQLTAGNLYHFDLAFSPRGELAFSNNRTGNYEIWVRAEKAGEKQLTSNPAIDSRPSWSPGGDAIAFESSRSGKMNIWRMPVSGGKARQLTDEAVGARYPVWWHGTTAADDE
ncbi:MAG TPA: hypothetical protein ENJ64_05305 [Thiotrichales bacterium]|nr:hypothetical protein [Thiotrichales bacterium]